MKQNDRMTKKEIDELFSLLYRLEEHIENYDARYINDKISNIATDCIVNFNMHGYK
jgi:hypothetical protein